MVSHELLQLQQILSLAPLGKKPVKDSFFVCIDCEAFEFDQSKITEIGISVLDSRSVKDVDPGEDGKGWFKLMKHVHLRPTEYKKLVNRRYIKGCPDYFNFGETAFITLQQAGPILDRIFSDPGRIYEACDLDTGITDVSPSIILVGHDLKSDTAYLRRLNFEPKHVDGQIDTQRLARISKAQSPGLSKLLSALSIEARNLHNAGNDAAYTLQALVGVAVQEHREPGSVVRTLRAEKAKSDVERAAKKAEKTQEKAKQVDLTRTEQAAKDVEAAARRPFVAERAEAKAERDSEKAAQHAKAAQHPEAAPKAKATQKAELTTSTPSTITNGSAKRDARRSKVLPSLGEHPTTRPEEPRRQHKAFIRKVRSTKGG